MTLQNEILSTETSVSLKQVILPVFLPFLTMLWLNSPSFCSWDFPTDQKRVASGILHCVFHYVQFSFPAATLHVNISLRQPWFCHRYTTILIVVTAAVIIEMYDIILSWIIIWIKPSSFGACNLLCHQNCVTLWLSYFVINFIPLSFSTGRASVHSALRKPWFICWYKHCVVMVTILIG